MRLFRSAARHDTTLGALNDRYKVGRCRLNRREKDRERDDSACMRRHQQASALAPVLNR